MRTFFTPFLLVVASLLCLNMSAQDIYYGDNYIVFEAETSNSPLPETWELVAENDPDYLKYDTTTVGVPPISNTYMQYVGTGKYVINDISQLNNVVEGTPYIFEEETLLKYKFIAPKTTNYRLLMRLHQPLEEGEQPTQKNEVKIRMSGNFTSATDGVDKQDLEMDVKFYGSGINTWGNASKVQIFNSSKEIIYGFTAGEEYTFYITGGEEGTCIDYILFIEDLAGLPEIERGADLATILGEEYRPSADLPTKHRYSPTDIYYGEDYIVFDAEATNSSLDKWKVMKPGDAGYQEFVLYSKDVEPIFDTYLQYTGGWQTSNNIADNSRLEYHFKCPKTGDYRLLVRMHQPLEMVKDKDGNLVREAGDQKNDFFVKMDGNFTSKTKNTTKAQLEEDHKFWGRGQNKWGSCHKLEIGGAHKELIYGFTEGETYTFTLSGRSGKTCIDYVLLYDVNTFGEIPQGEDVAKFFPAEYRPGLNLVDPVSVDLGQEKIELRYGTSMPLELAWNPINSKKDVQWSSSDKRTFTVDADGVLKAEGNVGSTAMLKVESTVNNVMDSALVEIVGWYAVSLTAIELSPENPIVGAGQSVQLSANLIPSYADNRELVWTSSDTAIAVVDSTGLVTAKAEGKVMIKAAAADNASVFDEVEVITAEMIAAYLKYDDEAKYKTTEYVVGDKMPVSVEYHAGTFNKVTDAKMWLRHMNSSWKVVKDYTQTIPNGIVGSESGTLNIDIDLTGVTPTADLPSGDFYFLFTKMTMSDGTAKNKGLNPIKIIEAASALNENGVNKVLVYPNPASDFIMLNVEQTSSVIIYNASGKSVLSTTAEPNEMIETSNLASGIYFVEVNATEGRKIEKLIIK